MTHFCHHLTKKAISVQMNVMLRCCVNLATMLSRMERVGWLK